MLPLIDWVHHVSRMIVKIVLDMGPANGSQQYTVNPLSLAESISRMTSEFVNK